MLTDKEIKKIAKLVAKEVIETFVKEYACEMKVVVFQFQLASILCEQSIISGIDVKNK